jgi:hypothetical protein
MGEAIAILGWGSLLWDRDPAFDSHHDPWIMEGPTLKIEFSRISASRHGALTLVIDAANGTPTQVAYCLSTRATITDARDDLQKREGTRPRHIGWIAADGGGRGRDDVTVGLVRDWIAAKDFGGAVWTDLPPNFEEKSGQPFSTETAVAYVHALAEPGRTMALEYIQRAPEFVKTPVRLALTE